MSTIREDLGESFEAMRALGERSTYGGQKVTEMTLDELYALLGVNLRHLQQTAAMIAIAEALGAH